MGSKFCINAVRDYFKKKTNKYVFVLQIVKKAWDGFVFYLSTYQSETGLSLDLDSSFS